MLQIAQSFALLVGRFVLYQIDRPRQIAGLVPSQTTYFDHDRFGEFPMAFGMGPAIMDLRPGVAQWYYEQAGPNVEFFSDVSGMGYVRPEEYAAGFLDRDALIDGFFDWTRRYMKQMDMHTLRTVRGDDAVLRQYAAKLPDMHSIFADMGCYSGRKGIAALTYSLPSGMPVFRAATTWRRGKTAFLDEVRAHVGDTRPAFVSGFLHCWTFKSMDDIAAIYDQRDADMVFVSPRQLAALYRQHVRKTGAQ